MAVVLSGMKYRQILDSMMAQLSKPCPTEIYGEACNEMLPQRLLYLDVKVLGLSYYGQAELRNT